MRVGLEATEGAGFEVATELAVADDAIAAEVEGFI